MSNPAATLHGHFNEIISYDRSSMTWPLAWKTRLEAEWEFSVGPLLALWTDTQQIVRTHQAEDADALLYKSAEWHRAILLNGVNLGAPFVQSGFELSADAVHSLLAVATIIGQYPVTTPTVPEEQLSGLAKAISELRTSIEESTELETDLRLFLLGQVAKMQDRLSQVRVSGTGPVEDLIAETIGSSAARSSMWDRAMASSLRDKIVHIFIAFNAIIGAINTTAVGIEAAAGHVSTATAVIEQIFTPPPQLEAPRQPKQIEPGPSHPPQSQSDDAGNTDDVTARD